MALLSPSTPALEVLGQDVVYLVEMTGWGRQTQQLVASLMISWFMQETETSGEMLNQR